MAILEAWDRFADNVSRRSAAGTGIKIVEETLRVDYALALYKTEVPQEVIWPEYPYPLHSTTGVDIYIDMRPQEYMEIKYLRELATGSHRPRTKWLGLLLADVYRLTTWAGDAVKFMLVAVDDTFKSYLHNKGITIPDVGQSVDHVVKVTVTPHTRETPVSHGIPNTVFEELPKQMREPPNQTFHFSWFCCRELDTRAFSVFLLRLSR